MMRKPASLSDFWRQLGPRFLPFADAATEDLPLGRLLRLSLFQVSVGMALVLLTGTLNRVMIVELRVPAWLVGLMVALPIVFAPFRALIGHKSDTHRSFLGWRRVPYIWFGTLLQFGGFAILPFALLVLSGYAHGPAIYGHIGAALAFLLVGAGLHTTQTAGLALASDLAPRESRPRVVALLYVMLLAGMVLSSLVFGALLHDFTEIQLIQIIQAAAAITFFLNGVALWKQEPRNPALTDPEKPRATFTEAWRAFSSAGKPARVLTAVGLGTAGFAMQDILLEPFGGEVFHMSVGATTQLTALLAGGALAGFALSARLLKAGADPYRLAALGALAGIVAFTAIIVSTAAEAVLLFRMASAAIGFGNGLFAVGMLTAAMKLAEGENSGLALGAWGAVQASAMGGSIALSGVVRDSISALADAGSLGPALTGVSTGYAAVYLFEIVLLFATLAAIGPLVRSTGERATLPITKFGLAEFPG